MNIFRKPTHTEVMQRQLAETQLELIEAEKALESWVATRDMLIKRRDRLKQQTSGVEYRIIE